MTGTVLIAGALGLVGRAALAEYEAAGWDIVALARRRPEFESSARFLSVDLTDADACRAALSPLRGITRIVYGALFEKPELGKGWLEADQIAEAVSACRRAHDRLGSRRRASLKAA